MLKQPLYKKCLTYDFKTLFEKNNYSFFTNGIYNVNIIGVRKTITNNKVTNIFDDVLVLDYNTANSHKRHIYNITTKPGYYYMQNPINNSGTAILVPGQYKGAYAIGLHNGKYKALCQNLKPVKVYRDGNKDDIFDLFPETIDNGMFGINIHRSNQNKSSSAVGKYSAGCQVFQNPKDFISFMQIISRAKDIYGNSFTYTLLDENELYE